MGENKIGKDTQKYDVCEIGGELFIVKNCVRFITGKNGMTYELHLYEVHLKVTRPVNPDPKTVAEFRRYCGVLADKLEQKRALKEQHDNEGRVNDMEENKQAFAEIMGAVFRNYTNEPVEGISYTRDDDGFEAATINFEDGTERTLNVTEKSCLAIMQDVYKALAR